MKKTTWFPIVLLLVCASCMARGWGRTSCGEPPSELTGSGAAVNTLILEPYLFETRIGDKIEAQKGRLTVPTNRQERNGKTIDLVFVRFKSTAKRPEPPILYLEGGPGDSGINTARGPAFPLLMALREVADVIVLDQRGTGQSAPIPFCDAAWDFPLDRPGERAEMLRIASARLRLCMAERTQQGIDLSAYNTGEMAADIDSLRAALHLKKVSLWGISFGTHLALQTIRQYPHHIHRAILSGVSGPDSGMIKRPEVLDQQLRKVDALLKADPLAGKAVPDLIGLVSDLLTRLDNKPATVEITDPQSGHKVSVVIGKWDAQFALSARLSTTWGIRSTPTFFGALKRGDLIPLAQAVFQFKTSKIGNLMPWLTIAASGVSAEKLRHVRSEASATVLGDAVNFLFPEMSEALGGLDLGPAFRTPIRSTVPTLFISGTLDGRTPVSEAEEVMKGFAKGQHLIVEGASHGYDLFYFFPDARKVMTDFLTGHPLASTHIRMDSFEFEASADANRSK